MKLIFKTICIYSLIIFIGINGKILKSQDLKAGVSKKEIQTIKKIRDINEENETNFRLEYHLKLKNGDTIGSLYIKPLKEDKEVFSSIIIKGFGTSINDTLYSIKGNIFRNTKGIDIKVFGQNHYGYRFIRKNESSFVIIALSEGGKNVSDNIWIIWNDEKGIFEVEKAP